MQKRFSKVLSEFFWIVGTFLLVFLATYGIYFAFNFKWIADGGTWQGLDVIPNLIFDTYLYLHWFGAEILSIGPTPSLPWIRGFFVFLHQILPANFGIIDTWLISKLILGTLGIWASAYTLNKTVIAQKWVARVIALIIWMYLGSVLGMRPGVYSWYLGFCVIAICLPFLTAKYLQEKNLRKAAAYSAGALILSSIYPWVFLFIVTWLSVIWASFILSLRKGKKCFLLLITAISLLAAISAPIIAGLPGVGEKILVLQRHGVFLDTRMPPLGNNILAVCVWIALFGLLIFSAQKNEKISKAFQTLWIAWVSMFFVWMISVFTSSHFVNDHFVIPTAILSWLSVGYLFSAMRQSQSVGVIFPLEKTPQIQKAAIFLFLFAALFCIYILQQPIRKNILKIDVYLIHVMIWSSLAAVAALFTWHKLNNTKTNLVLVVSMTIATALMLTAFVAVYVRGYKDFVDVLEIKDAITWINRLDTSQNRLCAEPLNAERYAGHTGRMIFPSESTFFYDNPDAKILNQLQVFSGAYNFAAAEQESKALFYMNYSRTLTCTYGNGQHRPQAKILNLFGLDEKTILGIIGCPDDTNKFYERQLLASIHNQQLNAEAFRELCPIVMVDNRKKDLWNLPGDYKETIINDRVSIWQH